MLAEDPDASLVSIAAAAGVGRGTAYRHFGTREDLVAAVRRQARDDAEASTADYLRPAGELAHIAPTPLSVTDVLNKVPPFQVGEQVIAEAQRLGGVTSAALYLVDLDGASMQRMAGRRRSPSASRCRWRSAPRSRGRGRRGSARRHRGGAARHDRRPAVHPRAGDRGAAGRRQRRRQSARPRRRGGRRDRPGRRLHRRHRDRAARAAHHARGRDPAEPPAPATRAHQRRDDRGQRAARLRHRRRLVRLRREPGGHLARDRRRRGHRPPCGRAGGRAAGRLPGGAPPGLRPGGGGGPHARGPLRDDGRALDRNRHRGDLERPDVAASVGGVRRGRPDADRRRRLARGPRRRAAAPAGRPLDAGGRGSTSAGSIPESGSCCSPTGSSAARRSTAAGWA